MTVANIPHSAPQRPQKRRTPDPARVYQTYLAERAIDEWGAYTRTAARYRKPDGRAYSPEWARKLCKAYEEAQQQSASEEVDELAYVAPPGGFPEPEPAPIVPNFAEDNCESTATSNPVLMSSVNGKTAEVPNPEPSNFQAGELENSATAAGELPLPVPAPVPEPLPIPLPGPEPLPQPEPFPVPVPVPGPNPVQIVTRVVRVPLEQRRGGLVGWLAEHDGARMQLLALVTFLVLVALSWLG